MNPLRTIWEGLRTTTAGLRVTIPYIWKKPVTTQYPHQRLELPERTRNRLYVNMDDCIGCDQCARACPVNCIDIETVKAVGDDTPGQTSQGKKKALWVTRFDIDIAKCCYCGLCVYPCPTECIWMTDVFEFAETERSDLIYNFVTLTPEEIAEKKAKGALAEKPADTGASATASAAPAPERVEKVIPGVPASDEDKAARLAELQRKMAEAKARREGGESGAIAPPTSTPGAAAGVEAAPDTDKAAKLAELQRKMAEAKARREAGESTAGPSPAQGDTSTSADAVEDEKRARVAELQRKMAEAKARRIEAAPGESPQTTPDTPSQEASTGGGTESPQSSQDAASDDKAARIAELQRKMAEAKARREAGEQGGERAT